jgi:ABC-type lipoprotein export system ATPase subunit
VTEPIISLRGIRKRYRGGPEVLAGVDLDIAEGEIVALMGRSGCGKTTLLNIMGGLDADFDGQARVAGLDIHSLSDAKLSEFRNARIGFIFQAFHLLEHLNCLENVGLPSLFARDGGLGAGELRTRAEALLARVGLDGVGQRYPGELSGGERQRVAIARSLFCRPRVLLADEPTGNLDARTGDSILDMFRTLNDEEGLTLVMVTHDEVVARSAHRIVRLEAGRLDAREAA